MLWRGQRYRWSRPEAGGQYELSTAHSACPVLLAKEKLPPHWSELTPAT